MMNVKFEKLVNMFQDEVKASESLAVVEPAGERHGSWVWTAHSAKDKPYKGLNRFVTLSLTGGASPYEMEIWAGADDNERFVRHLVVSFDVAEESLKQSAVLDRTMKYLREAVSQAESLQLSDLTETYLPSVPRWRS